MPIPTLLLFPDAAKQMTSLQVNGYERITDLAHFQHKAENTILPTMEFRSTTGDEMKARNLGNTEEGHCQETFVCLIV